MKTLLRTRLLGARAELLFSAQCHELGYYVSKPWSDDCPYDFILDTGKRLIRVQVKSTSSPASKSGGYYCTIRRRSGVLRSYRKKDVDVIAVYISPEEAWVIIPVRELSQHTTFYFKPRDPNSQYSSFVEAWHLLK